MTVTAISAPHSDPYSHTHPALILLDLGHKYEGLKLEAIVKNNQEQQETTAQLNILNDMMNFMLDLEQEKKVDEIKLKETLYSLNKELPDLNFHEFLDNYKDFNEATWQLEKQKITNKEKLLLATFGPKMTELDGHISDKDKVHEILAEIIKLLTKAVDYSVRKQS